MNPECRDGNCHKCDGSGWDEMADAPGVCTCTCHATIGTIDAAKLVDGPHYRIEAGAMKWDRITVGNMDDDTPSKGR